MTSLRYPWMSDSARLLRAAVACLVAFVFAFSIITSETAAAPSPIQSDGLLTLSSQSAADHTSSSDPADAGILLHVHCGCHQVMRAEPVTFEPVRTADRVVYRVQTEPLASHPASPLRRPPRV
jgi:hypothetical protein